MSNDQSEPKFEVSCRSIVESVDSKRVIELLCSDYKIYGQVLNSETIKCLVEHISTIYTANYSNSKDCDRYYVREQTTVQNLWNPVKAYIYQDSYVDIDIVNCHPSILKQLAIKHQLDHKHLDHYIEHRSDVLSIYNLKKSDINKVVNGAEIENFPYDLKTELKLMISQLCQIYQVKIISELLFREERKLLDSMINFFNSKNIKIVGLFHDGVVVEKSGLNYVDELNIQLSSYTVIHKKWNVPKINIINKQYGFDFNDPFTWDNVLYYSGSKFENQGDADFHLIQIGRASCRERV